jgi:predicted Zn-dependent protease
MFAYTKAQFEQICQDVLKLAAKKGASQAAVEVSEGYGLSVGTRLKEVEKIENNRDKSLGVTIYLGETGHTRRGNASTSDLTATGLEATVQAAYDIARFTAEDDCAGLPEPELLERRPRDLNLLHPWELSVEQAITISQRMEGNRILSRLIRSALWAATASRATACRARRLQARATTCMWIVGTAPRAMSMIFHPPKLSAGTLQSARSAA